MKTKISDEEAQKQQEHFEQSAPFYMTIEAKGYLNKKPIIGITVSGGILEVIGGDGAPDDEMIDASIAQTLQQFAKELIEMVMTREGRYDPDGTSHYEASLVTPHAGADSNKVH